MENMLKVEIEIGGMTVSAYLTDEGLVVDIFDDGTEECIATGYRFFSEADLEPPRIKTEE